MMNILWSTKLGVLPLFFSMLLLLAATSSHAVTVNVNYTYDNIGRLTSTSYTNATGVSSLSYTYDSAGNMLASTTMGGGAQLDTDNDGVPDPVDPANPQPGEDAFPYDPAASLDADKDGHPDGWNGGKTSADSTTVPSLTLDAWPNDPARWNDAIAPVITLIGPATVQLIQGQSYVDAGATALDNVDGDLTTNITTNNMVQTMVVGAYIVTFDVSDASANAANKVIRTVIVIANLQDAFPADPAASLDSDGDGSPDGWDAGKTVIDSITGLVLDAFPKDGAASVDRDGDGFPDVWNAGKTAADSITGLQLDVFPQDSTRWTSVPVASANVSINSPSFRTGDTVTLNRAFSSAMVPANADLYIALGMPDGSLYLMLPQLAGFTATITPMQANVPVPNVAGSIFSYTFTGSEPVGIYTWYIGVADPGTLNFQSPITSVPLIFVP